jgi:hypothetical protein
VIAVARDTRPDRARDVEARLCADDRRPRATEPAERDFRDHLEAAGDDDDDEIRVEREPERQPEAPPASDAPPPRQQQQATTSQPIDAEASEGQPAVSTAITAATTTAVASSEHATTENVIPTAEPRRTTSSPPPYVPVTPLEQAVIDLIEQSIRSTDDEEAPTEMIDASPDAPIVTLDRVHQGPAEARGSRSEAQTAAPPAPAAPSDTAENAHAAGVRLVVGDDADRVVIAVRVRGEHVDVALQAADELTAAMLARNAPVLADALRTRNLDLSNLATGERDARQRRERAPREPQGDRDDAPPFELLA